MHRTEAIEQSCFGSAVTFANMYPGKDMTQYTDDLVIKTMVDISLTQNGTILRCNWRNYLEECYDQFHPILTDDGICYTFNALNSYDLYTD